MKIHLRHLDIRTRRTIERIYFSDVTFLHGPVSTGKSTVARLIDYCLGGDLERTPAIQQEFVSADLALILGSYNCTIERAADDNQGVRVTWSGDDDSINSINAPLSPHSTPLLDAEVYNLSDLIFYLCGITPIKVRKQAHNLESPLIRLSIRDIWWYCYLDQTHLDSSFFRLEDGYRGRKSQDAMRFFTGLHSERLSQLEDERMRVMDDQRGKREAVQQIRSFMERFEIGSELNIAHQLQIIEQRLSAADLRRIKLEQTRSANIHPTDTLRNELRQLSAEVENIFQAVIDSTEVIAEQKALRAELLTTKVKADRAQQAGNVLQGVRCQRCPECGTDISGRPYNNEMCRLCGTAKIDATNMSSVEIEVIRRDLNERIDQITNAIERHEHECRRMERHLLQTRQHKATLDQQLERELVRYDSAFVESIRGVEREIATLLEQRNSLRQLQQMPEAINRLEQEAGTLQGNIDRLRTLINEERSRLRDADANIAEIATEFKRIMLAVSFPGVSEEDQIVIDPRSWKPVVIHGGQEWTFWDTGSGGKKTLFNVCYALALHAVALERDMPVPDILIIDSPTKNISEDENPVLVQSLYSEIYRLAQGQGDRKLQFLLIDSDIVVPSTNLPDFFERRMAGEPEAPSLIPYYTGP